jgi:hypothetical protein
MGFQARDENVAVHFIVVDNQDARRRVHAKITPKLF